MIETQVVDVQNKIIGLIDSASAADLAGLASGRLSICLSEGLDAEILRSDAGGKARQLFVGHFDACGSANDLELLAAAVAVVGMPSGCESIEDIEVFDNGDSVRAAGIAASDELASRVRAKLYQDVMEIGDEIDNIVRYGLEG